MIPDIFLESIVVLIITFIISEFDCINIELFMKCIEHVLILTYSTIPIIVIYAARVCTMCIALFRNVITRSNF